jgi:hypothetical protein
MAMKQKDLKCLLCDDDRDKIQEIVFWTCVEHGFISYDYSNIPDFQSVDFTLTAHD